MALRDLFGTEGFWGAIRAEDLLDIFLVAAALSLILSWLKRRATRPLLFALALGIAVYALARWLNLYLTLQLFRVAALVLLAATLLAYQEDLRRAFERLTTGQIFRRRKAAPDDTEQAISAVTEVAFDLAERRFGALIVIRGIEHLDRHLRGGWAVDGKPSVPLLLSIFDPHTPAHDGAAVIDERGRLDRVGSHLPLTSNLVALAGRGTRHAAALGLSENCDAIVVVVSEERGNVSLARAGQIEPIPSEEALGAALKDFVETKRPRPGRRRTPWPRDLEIKLASTALAVALWLALAAPSAPVQRTYPVTIELQNVPRGWHLEGPQPATVDVTLVGPEPVFRELAPEELRLSFDLSKIEPGENLIPSESGSINAPAPLHVARYDVETIWVTARPPGQTQ
jgi:uncharacterized protein (TIGR00159 family)